MRIGHDRKSRQAKVKNGRRQGRIGQIRNKDMQVIEDEQARV